MTSGMDYTGLLALAKRRRSTRTFAARKVPGKDIDRIIELCRTSPYACGSSSWDILALSDSNIIADMANAVKMECERIASSADDCFREDMSGYCQWFYSFGRAPAVLLPVFRIQKTLSLAVPAEAAALTAYENETFAKSIACVSMLALLGAESLGLGACLMTGPLLAEKQLSKIAGVKPGRRIGALIPIGYREEQNR